jgi:hypothetical protein
MSTLTTYTIQSPCRLLPENAKVVALIDIDSKWRNVSLLREIFGVEEAKIISKITLSKYRRRDVLI